MRPLYRLAVSKNVAHGGLERVEVQWLAEAGHGTELLGAPAAQVVGTDQDEWRSLTLFSPA